MSHSPQWLAWAMTTFWSIICAWKCSGPLALFLKPSPSLDPLHSDHSDLRSHVSEGRVLTWWVPPDVLSLHEREVSLVFHEVTEIPVFICCHGITWFPRSDSQTSSTEVTWILLKGRFLVFFFTRPNDSQTDTFSFYVLASWNTLWSKIKFSYSMQEFLI